MTKRLFILAGVFFASIVLAFIFGIGSNAPALLVLSLFCSAPLFFLTLGAALGRASNEFVIARKQITAKNIPANRTVQAGRVPSGEPLG